MKFDSVDYPYSYAIWYLKEASSFWSEMSAAEIEKVLDKAGSRDIYKILADLYVDKHKLEVPEYHRRFGHAEKRRVIWDD